MGKPMVWPWAHHLLLSIANFYMEHYKKAMLEFAPLKPRCRFCYGDNTIIWLHGPDKFKDFLHHLNSIHQSIQFTMETETEGHLPFLNLDIYRRPHGSLGHTCTASSTPAPSPITTHPIKKQYFLLWCTGPESSVMMTVCRPSWCSSGTSSNRMAK
jgi:hypothetical protein